MIRFQKSGRTHCDDRLEDSDCLHTDLSTNYNYINVLINLEGKDMKAPRLKKYMVICNWNPSLIYLRNINFF